MYHLIPLGRKTITDGGNHLDSFEIQKEITKDVPNQNFFSVSTVRGREFKNGIKFGKLATKLNF